MMEAEGIEAVASAQNPQQNVADQSGRGAKSGARDPELSELLAAWPSLPASSRADVLAIVRAVSATSKPTGRAVGASAGKEGRKQSRAAKPLSTRGFRQSAAQQQYAGEACSGSARIGRTGRRNQRVTNGESSRGSGKGGPQKPVQSRSAPELRTAEPRAAKNVADVQLSASGSRVDSVRPPRHQKKAATVQALGGAHESRRVPSTPGQGVEGNEQA